MRRWMRSVIGILVLILTSWLALAPSAHAQWVVLAGPNGRFARNIPDEAFQKLNQFARQGSDLKSIAFAPNGGWIILFDKNGHFARNISDEAFQKIGELAKNGSTLKSITFTPSGGWVILFDRNGYFARNIPDEAFRKLGEFAGQKADLKSIAFTPSGGWVILAGRNDYFARDIPDEAYEKLGEFAKQGLGLRSISFDPGGGWVVLADRNVYFARNIPDEAYQQLGDFAKRRVELKSLAFAPGSSIRLSVDDAETRRQVLDRMDAHKVPGLGIALINDGRIAWARGYGVARAGSNAAVTPSTRFQAASVSKPVAAFVALRLVQKGMLSLDEPLNKKLTSWKVPDNSFTKRQAPTLRQALSHSAGFTVHGFGGYESGGALPTLRQILDGAAPANSAPIRVAFLPGSKVQYSGGGFTVAQQLIVDAAGTPFPQTARTLALDPLQMTESTYEQPLPSGLTSAAAAGHSDGTPIAGSWHVYPEMAAAGLWTTPSDIAKFIIGLQQSKRGDRSAVLSSSLAGEMLRRQKGDAGLGVFLSGSGPNMWFSHNGVNAGFECGFTGSVNGGQGAVVMTNAQGGSALVEEILHMLRAEYGWQSS